MLTRWGMAFASILGFVLVLLILAIFAACLPMPEPAGAEELPGTPPFLQEWQMYTAIAQHVHSGIDAPFDSRDDFVLLLPFEYGFNGRGACVEYTERPSIEQVYYSVQVVEHGLVDPDTILWEDGSCQHVPGSAGLSDDALTELLTQHANQ